VKQWVECYDRQVLTKPAFLLRLEGASILSMSIFFYHQSHASWILFAALFLSPDLFMLGYLVNARVGAAVYNFVHTLLAPGVLIVIAILASKWQLFPGAFIWTAHIGLDRMLGYGLKYPTRFKDTHLRHV
jgi:hypothetical protein